MPFKNFSMWRGRLPHWRADDVTYYVVFRHRRPLATEERRLLLRALLRPDGDKWHVALLAVLPEATHLIFQMKTAVEFADLVEAAKTKTGKQIIKKSGERWPPFWHESFDRIIRDQDELETRYQEVFDEAARVDDDGEVEATIWISEETPAVHETSSRQD